MASDAASGASARTGGVDASQPAAPAAGRTRRPCRTGAQGRSPTSRPAAASMGPDRVDRGRRSRRPSPDRRSGTCTCTTRRSRRSSRGATARRCRPHAPGPSRPWPRRRGRRPSSRSISCACPVAKLTPARKTRARSSACSRIAASRSAVGIGDAAPAALDHHQIARRVEPSLGEVARDRVAIGREERAVDEDPPAPAGRPEERGQQQVDVDGQPVQDGHLGRPGADDPGHRFAEAVRPGEPGPVRIEPGVDAEPRPGVELGVDRGARGPWLQPERLARQVDRGRPVGRDRQQEAVAQRGQRVGRVPGERVGLAGQAVRAARAAGDVSQAAGSAAPRGRRPR